MPIESPVNYIEDLNSAWPAGPEDAGDGDDHDRLTKKGVQGSFPNLGQAAVTASAAELSVMNGVTSFLDEDDMASDSATAIASQQSIKTYVDNKTSLNLKVINIGTWNMDTNGFVDVAHGVTFAKIRTITALIRNDVDTTYYTLDSDNGGHSRADATNVRLTRLASGQFDSTGFDTMGDDGNRGWITIQYVD